MVNLKDFSRAPNYGIHEKMQFPLYYVQNQIQMLLSMHDLLSSLQKMQCFLVRGRISRRNFSYHIFISVKFRRSFDLLREGLECIRSKGSPTFMLAWSGLVLRSPLALGEIFKSFSSIEKRVEMVQELLLLPISRFVTLTSWCTFSFLWQVAPLFYNLSHE